MSRRNMRGLEGLIIHASTPRIGGTVPRHIGCGSKAGNPALKTP